MTGISFVEGYILLRIFLRRYHSKDKRYRWARNRWVTKEGVHIQYAEGNQRVIKHAFSSYGCLRPEYSQLYLNEFCFFRNLKVFGLEAIVQNWRERIGVEVEKVPTAIEDKNRLAGLSKWRRSAKPALQAPFAIPKLKAILPTQVRIVS